MSVALQRENFILHRLHSISGVVPVGFYMVQHLTLNSFSLAGPDKFNAVIEFFEGIPKHILLLMEIGIIWLPLLFHCVYGLFITNRAKTNYIGTKYGWNENRMFYFQRASGIVIFLFLIYHSITTTIAKYVSGSAETIKFDAMHTKLTSFGFLPLAFYALGILCASYHLSYGLWNICVRWGITISDSAQAKVQKISAVAFVVITCLGWAALVGFVMPHGSAAPLHASLVR